MIPTLHFAEYVPMAEDPLLFNSLIDLMAENKKER